MSDDRSRREKLTAMANQTVSPREAEIARRLLVEMDTASPAQRARVEAEADRFVARMSFEYNPSGITVRYDGVREPGVLGSMLREALRGERAPKL